jgi:hypothetical protein
MSDLPDVLKVTPLKRPINQECSTDILQPTTFSQTSCKFVLPNVGILDANSQLHLSQVVTDSTAPAVDTKSFYPATTGACAMVQRCFLTIGGKEVCDVRDVNQYINWKRHHYSNEYKKGVAMVHQAGNDVYMGSAGLVDTTNFTAQEKAARGFLPPYGVIGRESSEYGFVDTTAGATFAEQSNTKVNTEDKAKRLIPYEASRTPGMLISLAQIIPLLVGVQLPLFAIEQEVAIIIEWAAPTWGHRFMFAGFNAAGDPIVKTNLTSTIVEDDVFLVMDTLFYPSLMADIKEQIFARGGYSIGFDDVITQSNYLLYQQNQGTTTHDFQVPLSGKRVKRVIVQKQAEQEQIVEALNCGFYNSVALRTGEEYNFRIDNNNVYSIPIKNTALQRQEVDAVEGIPLVMNSNVYSYKNVVTADGQIPANGATITPRLLNTHVQTNEIGSQHYIGLKIENAFGQGHLMGIHPLIYTEKGLLTQYDGGTGTAPNRQSARVVRFFAVYQKIMNINNGIVEVID